MQDIHISHLDKKRSYVVGLTWQAEAAPSAKKQAAIIKQTTDGMMLLPEDERPTHRCTQAIGEYLELGFSRLPRSTHDVAPLANLITNLSAKNDVKTWAAILKLEDGLYWFGGAIDGITLPGSDIVGDKDKVLSVWADKASLFMERGSTIYVGADDSDMPNVTVIDLDAWLLEIPLKTWKSYSLKPISGANKQKIVLLALLVAGVAGLYGLSAWKKHQQEQEFAKLSAQAKMAPLQANQQAANVTPWKTQPTATGFITGCMAALRGADLWVPGWTTKDAVCEAGQLKLEFDQAENAAAFGLAPITNAYPAINILAGGKRATASIQIKGDPTPESKETPMQEQQLIRSIHGAFLELGVKSIDLSPLGGATAGALKGYKFTVKSDVLGPQDIATILANIPTLRVTRAVVINPYKTDLEGVVYAL